MQFFAKPSGPSNVIEMFFKVHWPSYAIISDGRQPSVQLCDVSFKSNWQKLLFLAPYIKSPQKETLKRRSQISWLLEIMRIYCYFSPLCFGCRQTLGMDNTLVSGTDYRQRSHLCRIELRLGREKMEWNGNGRLLREEALQSWRMTDGVLESFPNSFKNSWLWEKVASTTFRLKQNMCFYF